MVGFDRPWRTQFILMAAPSYSMAHINNSAFPFPSTRQHGIIITYGIQCIIYIYAYHKGYARNNRGSILKTYIYNAHETTLYYYNIRSAIANKGYPDGLLQFFFFCSSAIDSSGHLSSGRLTASVLPLILLNERKLLSGRQIGKRSYYIIIITSYIVYTRSNALKGSFWNVLYARVMCLYLQWWS